MHKLNYWGSRWENSNRNHYRLFCKTFFKICACFLIELPKLEDKVTSTMGNTTSQGSTPQRQTPRVDLSPAGWEISSEAESHELYRAVCRMSEARDPQCFHQAMLDALSAAQSARAGLDSQQYRRFINTWTNWALFYVCHRVSNSGNAGELMKKISMYVQHETDEMACAWRYSIP